MADRDDEFKKLLDAFPLSVLIAKEPEGMIIYINEKAADTLQLPVESALGQRGLDFLVEPGKREELVKRLGAGEGTVRVQALCRTMSGREFTATLHASLVNFRESPCIVIVSDVG